MYTFKSAKSTSSWWRRRLLRKQRVIPAKLVFYFEAMGTHPQDALRQSLRGIIDLIGAEGSAATESALDRRLCLSVSMWVRFTQEGRRLKKEWEEKALTARFHKGSRRGLHIQPWEQFVSIHAVSCSSRPKHLWERNSSQRRIHQNELSPLSSSDTNEHDH